MAFGAFLAGMMLGETEFRHQVEAAIRPFRDMLLGLVLRRHRHAVRPARVAGDLALGHRGGRRADDGQDADRGWPRAGGRHRRAHGVADRTAAGGRRRVRLRAARDRTHGGRDLGRREPGRPRVGAAVDGGRAVADPAQPRDRAPTGARAACGSARRGAVRGSRPRAVGLSDHVIICGYGRIGQSVGHFLEEEKIRYVALDLDASRVREAHLAGEPVYYGDASERAVLESVGIGTCAAAGDQPPRPAAALRLLGVVRELRPELPVMVRTRDESHVDELRRAGAVEVVPETLEAALMIAAHALLLLDVPLTRVLRRIQAQRVGRYRLLGEFIRGEGGHRRRGAAARRRAAASGAAAAAQLGGRATAQGTRAAWRVGCGPGARRKEAPRPAGRPAARGGDVLVLFGASQTCARPRSVCWSDGPPARIGRGACWWRRRESNPRPQALHSRTYMLSRLFVSRRTLPERQGRRSTSSGAF